MLSRLFTKSKSQCLSGQHLTLKSAPHPYVRSKKYWYHFAKSGSEKDFIATDVDMIALTYYFNGRAVNVSRIRSIFFSMLKHA